jgi:Fic family protein
MRLMSKKSETLKKSKKFDIIYMKDEGRKTLKKPERKVDTMEKTKMTYVKALDAVLTGADVTEEVLERLTALKATLEKRAATPRKPRKEDPEKAAFRQTVLEYVADTAAPLKAGEVAEALGVKVQKVTPALTRLVRDGALVKAVEGSKPATYAVAGLDTDAE